MMTERAEQAVAHIEGRTRSVADILGERAEHAALQIEGRTRTATDLLAEKTEQAAVQVESRTRVAADALLERSERIVQQIEARTGAVTEMLASRSESVTSQVESRTKAAAESLNARLESLATSVSQNTGEAERSMSQLANASTESMRTAAAEVERVLTVVSAGIGSALKQNANDVERTLLSVSAEVARGFVGKSDEIAAAVSSRAAEMTRVLDANSSTLLAALSAKSQEFTGEVQKATHSAVSAIESKGFDFTRTMLENSNELARLINDAGETATARVNQTMQNLQHTTREAIDQTQQIANDSVAQVMETHARLRGESTTLFERMREANVLLHEVLTGAHENMAIIEDSLTSRVTEFANAMNDVTARSGTVGEQINAHVESFRSDTTAVLENLSGLAAQFAQQGRMLVEAVDSVEKSNRRTEETVSERRATLEALVTTLDMKSEDLEQRLQRFTALLDQSLDGAESRAREIGRMIAESSTTGTRTIAEQFELVRAATEEDSKRTSDLMREIYEQSIGETDNYFRQSTERFAETLSGMKEMAAEMQAQLEQTRAELRRGILELPQETAENAAQMRRVIVDQIEALAELNRIVSRHGRSIEATEPRRASEPVLAVVGGGRAEPARPQARLPEQPQAPVRTAPPPPPAPRAESYPQSAPAGRGNQSGWLSDLLQRADDGQTPVAPPPGRQLPPAAPQRPLDSLDALSADIARLVEHEAAIDMWDRYNRGERGAFTRQLYTMNGQRTYDDIRNRYRADRNFRATVDRYISEFERLLEDVSRDERGGQAMVRTYLISETGKVYTMLAHAAGRFD
jgi:hypothetical protein